EQDNRGTASASAAAPMTRFICMALSSHPGEPARSGSSHEYRAAPNPFSRDRRSGPGSSGQEANMRLRGWILLACATALVRLLSFATGRMVSAKPKPSTDFLGNAQENARQLITDGERIFRFDTFGDEAFWGGVLHLHEAVATLSPSAALGLGLKVDAEALPPQQLEALKHGRINLNDPAVTLALIKENAVLGVVGTFDSNGGL